MSGLSVDIAFMRHALALAERSVGKAWPNPPVGAVIVQNGNVVGRGWTAKGGRPHAESIALQQAGAAARHAILYVTLEPCAHIGKTLPCTDAIINAGIRRVVAAATDLNPQVYGNGFAALRSAGIEVVENICKEEAQAVLAGFFSTLQRKRPYISVKIASSLDGKVATASGESQWITGEHSRNYGQRLRVAHDAMLTGINTVLNDDPQLTCRLPGLAEQSPVRVVIDTQLRLPLGSQLVKQTAQSPVWVITSEAATNSAAANALRKTGVVIHAAPVKNNRVDLAAACELLAREGLTTILAEAGPTLAGALIQANLVDKLYWFRSPMMLGDAAKGALLTDWGTTLADMPRWKHQSQLKLGEDMLEVYIP